MKNLITINKYNFYGYLLAFDDDVLDEICTLELFRFLINSKYINGLEQRFQDAAKALISNDYLIYKDKEFVINKSRLKLN